MKTAKTSVVTTINENHRQWTAPDKVTKFIHYLEFQNGDRGEYFSDSSRCSEFSINQLVEYSIEQKNGLGGKPTFRISPINRGGGSNTGPQRPSNGGGDTRPPFSKNNGSGKPQRNENAIMSQFAIGRSIDLINGGKVHPKNLYPKALEILQWTHKHGNMSVEEILALPVEFVVAEIEKKGKKDGDTKSKLF